MDYIDKLIIKTNVIEVIDAFFSPPITPEIIATTITHVIAEKLLDGALPSINWFSKAQLNEMNSIEGLEKLVKLVRAKIGDSLDGDEFLDDIWIPLQEYYGNYP